MTILDPADRASAADPAVLFRRGGRTLGDLARQIPVPGHIPPEARLAFQMDALFGDRRAAHSRFHNRFPRPSAGKQVGREGKQGSSISAIEHGRDAPCANILCEFRK